MSARTPGPWKIVFENGGGFGPWSGLGIWTDEPIEERNRVAVVVCDSIATDEPAYRQAHADARLMVAAPDLLKACIEARAILSYASPPNPKTDALLDAAIKKARGG